MDVFVCELCGSQVAPRIPARRVVLEWRAKRYPPRDYRLKRIGRSALVRDRGGAGYEIAREALACPDCARYCTVPAPPPVAQKQEQATTRAGSVVSS